MDRKYGKRDRFINLLPREYLPEPEFRAFWIVAILMIGALGFYLYTQHSALQTELKNKTAAAKVMGDKNMGMIQQIIPVPVIQANSRMILLYLFSLPGIIELGPDWLNIYLELENQVKPGLWVDRMSFLGGNDRGIWPGIRLNGISASPGPVEKVLVFANDLEKSSQFIGVSLKGWQWVDLPEGQTGVAFQITMGIER